MSLSAAGANALNAFNGKAAKLFLALTVILWVWWASFGRLSWQDLTYQFDLVPFYCGGTMVAAHENPYTVEPIRTCEHRVGRSFGKGSKLSVPAPQPAYELEAFAILSHLPFSVLSKIWTLVEIATFFATIGVLMRLTALPLATVFASLAISDFYSSLLLGQTAAICVLGISLIALGLSRGRAVIIGIGLLLASTEPHIALPAFIAVALFSKHRLVAIACGLMLAIVSLLSMPFHEIVQYVAAVLPAHALSELNNQDQFSAAYYLHSLGISASTSITIAKAQYFVMVLLSIAIARLSVAKLGEAAYGAVPPALVLIGGPFLHIHEAAAAIPALLLLAARVPGRYVYVCLAMLAVPWVNFSEVLTVLPAAPIVLVVLLNRGNVPRVGVVLTTLVATFGLGFAALWIAMRTHRVGHPKYGLIRPGDLAEGPWKALNDLQNHDHVFLANLTKFPTELALVGLLIMLLLIAKTSLDQRSRIHSEMSAA
jgi:hypothetical protein